MWQQDRAKKDHLEPYMVLQFNTIKEIVRLQPKTNMDLLHIKGIGPVKVRKYGDELLRIVRGDGVTRDFAQKHDSALDLFSEAQMVNDAAVMSENPEKKKLLFNKETGEILDDTHDAISVTTFVTMLDTTLRANFESVRVQGEVVGFKRNASGHAYFEIKDRESVLRCMVFSTRYDISGVALSDGMEIIITGYPNYHKQYGFGFVGITVELYGEGALKKAYDDLKKKLDAEGLFSIERKRELAQLPQRVGLITSRTGAAIGDFTTNVGQYGYTIIFHQSRVEGAQAVDDLITALRVMATKELDVLVIVRGGGSLESLQAFNNEKIVHMIANFPVPVIAGVGHEQDETLTTLVADKGVSTPTAAARAVREGWDQCGEYIRSHEQELLRNFEKQLSQKKDIIIDHEKFLINNLHMIIADARELFVRFMYGVHKMTSQLYGMHHHIDERQSRMIKSFDRVVNRGQHHVLRRSEQLEHFYDKMAHVVQSVLNRGAQIVAQFGKSIIQSKTNIIRIEKMFLHVDPRRQLALGYSITKTVTGVVIRSVHDVQKDDDIIVHIVDGTIKTKVLE